jgi:hypothetical protein
MLGNLVKWAVVIGVLFAVTNLGYYGYKAVFVDGYGSGDLAGFSGGNITVAPAPSPSTSVTGGSLRLAVPFTTQAPLSDWGKHQESCEEANLAQVSAYWSGNHSAVLDPGVADRSINALVTWQVKNWGSEDDLTDVRLGQLAEAYYGYQYEVLPMTDETMHDQLRLGHPVILGVTTHGLGNEHYPGYSTHYLQPGYSVSHFVTIVGFDGSSYVLNDPGLTPGRGYHVQYDQLIFAINNLDQQHPKLNEGLVMLVIHPKGS